MLFINSVYAFSNIKKGYVPSGLSESEWKNIKQKERVKKNYGKTGITSGFKSRSLNEFMKLKEEGKASYNFPVFNVNEKIKSGEINEKDIPYMQRKDGRPDNSDLSFFNKIKIRYVKFYQMVYHIYNALVIINKETTEDLLKKQRKEKNRF